MTRITREAAAECCHGDCNQGRECHLRPEEIAGMDDQCECSAQLNARLHRVTPMVSKKELDAEIDFLGELIEWLATVLVGLLVVALVCFAMGVAEGRVQINWNQVTQLIGGSR